MTGEELSHAVVTFQLIIDLSVTAPVSGRSSSRSSMAILVGTGPFAVVVALEDLKPRRRQNRGQVALRVS